MTAAGRPARARRRPAALAWALWALAMLSLAVNWWQDHLLRQAGRPDLAPLDAGVAALVLAAVSAATVGAVLASRRPRHPVGWLLLALGLSLNASGVASAYADYGLLARPGTLPAAPSVALSFPATVITALTCLGFVLLLTPTGSLPSLRWRWWARATAAAPAVSLLAITLAPRPFGRPYRAAGNPLDLRGLGGALSVTYQLAFAVANLAVVVGAASLVVRFRRARGTERQQLRWVALAAASAVLGFVVLLAAVAMGASPDLLGWVAGVSFAVLPLAIGAAVLRYRLYDLDRIVSRTLAYGLLTVLLGGGYAGLVLGLGQLLGRSSSLVVAGATLAVAAAFQPARRRVQQAVDRRFNRRRYDAARTIEGFSARLRQQVDLDTLTTELLAVVEQTMQPTQASLWLRPSVSAFPDQRGTGASRTASQPTPASRSVHAAS
ncbi:MAG TPA: hypothetical protein VF486_18480 [Actinomycetes bacterium]